MRLVFEDCQSISRRTVVKRARACLTVFADFSTTKFLARNTPLVDNCARADRGGMNTIVAAEANSQVDSEPMDRPVGSRRLPVDWTESEWFKVWLKLARHEEDGATREEAAC